MLRTKNIRKTFGGLVAVDDVSVNIKENSITGLIGPNGAGKTVFFNTLTGLYQPDSGSIYFEESDITTLPIWERVNKGLVRGFQLLRIFPEQSVRKNLVMAGMPNSFLQNFRYSMTAAKDSEAEEKADELIDRFGFRNLAETQASDLSYGDAKLLQFGMLLMKEPSLILLDEIMAGVNIEDTNNLLEQVREYNEEGITFFIVEHDVSSIMDICDRVLVLDQGQLIADGPPEEVRKDERVIDVYIGEDE